MGTYSIKLANRTERMLTSRREETNVAHILNKSIYASRLVGGGLKTKVGEKLQIPAGMAIDIGDSIPKARLIILQWNADKYVTDKALLEQAIKPK
jgi:hypothetical protein